MDGFGEKKARIGGFAYPYSPPREHIRTLYPVVTCLRHALEKVRANMQQGVATPHTCICTASRDHDLREHIPHTWASSDDNLFQSNFSAWSNCEAILGKTPDWAI